MTLDERMSQTRQLCKTALSGPELQQIHVLLARSNVDDDMQQEVLRGVAKVQAPTPQLLIWRDQVRAEGIPDDNFPLERNLLLQQALKALSVLKAVNVDESVMHLFCKEFSHIAEPFPEALPYFSLTAYPFVAMTKLTLLQRFPAGQHQWEISGFPRSWFPKIPMHLLPATVRFLLLNAGGLQPYFVNHLQPYFISRLLPPGKPILIESEFRKAFYRMARALEKQPQIRAIMASSWIHSLETHRVSPHLAFLNAPFLEAGGIVTDLGAAKPDDGFIARSKARANLYQSGLYRPTVGVVLCSRKQAISWANAHSEMEDLMSV